MCLIAAVKAASSSLHPASAGGLDDVVLLRLGAELAGSSDRIRLMASGPRPQRVPSPRRGGPVACHDRTGMASSLVLPAGSRRQTSGETRGSPLSKERERGGASRANRNGVYPVVLPESSRRSTSGDTRGSPLLAGEGQGEVRDLFGDGPHLTPTLSRRRGSAVVLHARTGMACIPSFSRKALAAPALETPPGPLSWQERDRVRCVTSSEMDHTSPQPSPEGEGARWCFTRELGWHASRRSPGRLSPLQLWRHPRVPSPGRRGTG